jgi:hypothetical protein
MKSKCAASLSAVRNNKPLWSLFNFNYNLISVAVKENVCIYFPRKQEQSKTLREILFVAVLRPSFLLWAVADGILHSNTQYSLTAC